MTDDPRLLELIQADVDGQLDGAEKAGLARRLLADPAARRLHGELRRTDALLRDLPSAEPPEGLRSGIQGALGLSDHDRGGGREADGGVGFRLAAAVVAGLVVVGLGYGLLSERRDTRDLQGSVAAGGAAVARLQAGGGQVVARLEGISADRSRLLLEPGPNVAGEVVVRTGAEGPSCRGPDPASGLSSPATGEWLLALPAGGRPATLECSGDGPIHLEVRLDGRLQDTATITLGP